MIVYPSGYEAAESAAGRPLYLPRILWKNLLKDLASSAITVSGETVGGPKDAVLRPDTYEYWLPPSLTATHETDIGADVSVSAIGLAAHTLGTAGSTLVVETQLNAGSWITFGAASHAPTNDRPIVLFDSPRTIDRVRMTITGTTVPRIGVLYVGPTLTMQKGLQIGWRPPTLNRRRSPKASISRGGQFLGQDYYDQGYKSNPSFKGLDATWYHTNFDPFADSTEPYFFVGRPDAFPDDVVYAWHSKDMDPQYTSSYQVSISWELDGMTEA